MSNTIQLHHVELEELECAVYGRDHNAAGLLLLQSLQRIRTGSEFAYKRLEDDVIAACYARMATAITAYICDPTYVPSDDAYIRLCTEVSTFEMVFGNSALRGPEHIARILADNPKERDPAKLVFNTAALAKWLMFCGLSSEKIGVNYEELFSKAARVTLPLWSGLLVSKAVFTALAMERKNALLHMGKYFESLDLPEACISPMADAFMYASYATAPDRHDVKRSMMKMFANSIKRRVDVPAVKRVKGRAKPTILIPIEWFGSYHAMHRSYAPVIRQLRDGFKLVAAARPSMLDENARSYFDDLLPLPETGTNLAAIIKDIAKLAPDIIFYPSVGMSLYWVALASVRLAPIQVMSVGHPATSMSPEMDYVIADQDVIEPRLFSETPVLLPPGVHFKFVARPDYEAVTRKRAFDPAVCRIGIPAIVMKLNPLFFDSLTRIEWAAKEKGVTVQYAFFPGGLGAEHRYISRLLRAMFEGSIVYPRLAGPKYLEHLVDCDFALAPFPFGGTNSTVDALLVGLPVVSLWGDQPHERFDGIMLRMTGLDDFLTQTPEQYERLCVELATTPELLRAARERVQRADINGAFYGPIPEPAWTRAFRFLYDNHENIKPHLDSVHWKDYMNGR